VELVCGGVVIGDREDLPPAATYGFDLGDDGACFFQGAGGYVGADTLQGDGVGAEGHSGAGDGFVFAVDFTVKLVAQGAARRQLHLRRSIPPPACCSTVRVRLLELARQ